MWASETASFNQVRFEWKWGFSLAWNMRSESASKYWPIQSNSKLSRNDLLKGTYHVHTRLTVLYIGWLRWKKWEASAKGLFIASDPIRVKNLNSFGLLTQNTVCFWSVVKYNESTWFSAWQVHNNTNCLRYVNVRVLRPRLNIPQSWQQRRSDAQRSRRPPWQPTTAALRRLRRHNCTQHYSAIYSSNNDK